MTGIYYAEAADWLRSAGITVHEIAGWKTRARSSGGFPNPGALGIQWHHTASKTTPQNDTNWQFFTSPDRPIGNMLLDRNGEVWIGAAGAANTAGKGGPLTLSRGTLPVDGANARTWAIEAANNGVGEQWPTKQIDAYFVVSNVLNRRFGNQPGDIFNHNTWAPGRKIDPAVDTAVAGSWRPGRSTSSGTWRQTDVTTEAGRRFGVTPAPAPPPPTGGTWFVQPGDSWWAISQRFGISLNELLALNPPATSSTVIHPGQKLNVPGSGPAPPPPATDWAAEGAKMTTPPASPVLRRGSVHPNVPWLQAVLSSMPQVGSTTPIFTPAWVGVDRIGSAAQQANLFGDATHNALVYWQGRNGVAADGVYGAGTAQTMARVRGK